MNDWKLLQMIKACEWPLAPELLSSNSNFNARLDGGLVSLHWACTQGNAGLVKHMAQHGANVQDADGDSFSKGHTDAKTRMTQTLKDWNRIAKKAGTFPAPAQLQNTNPVLKNLCPALQPT